VWKAFLAGLSAVSLSTLPAQQRESLAWAPVPAETAIRNAPDKPVWRLLAKHHGQPNWTETFVTSRKAAPGEHASARKRLWDPIILIRSAGVC
jgi:hypothetical protein